MEYHTFLLTSLACRILLKRPTTVADSLHRILTTHSLTLDTGIISCLWPYSSAPARRSRWPSRWCHAYHQCTCRNVSFEMWVQNLRFLVSIKLEQSACSHQQWLLGFNLWVWEPKNWTGIRTLEPWKPGTFCWVAKMGWSYHKKMCRIQCNKQSNPIRHEWHLDGQWAPCWPTVVSPRTLLPCSCCSHKGQKEASEN